jgi:hypothetical protein
MSHTNKCWNPQLLYTKQHYPIMATPMHPTHQNAIAQLAYTCPHPPPTHTHTHTHIYIYTNFKMAYYGDIPPIQHLFTLHYIILDLETMKYGKELLLL